VYHVRVRPDRLLCGPRVQLAIVISSLSGGRMPDPSLASGSNPASEPNPVSEPKPASPSPAQDAGHMPMTEEMDSAKWRLPPALPVLGSALVLAVVVVTLVFVLSRPVAVGKVLSVTSVEQLSKASILVAVNAEVSNVSKEPLTIQQIHVQLTPPANAADQSILQDEAAPAVDYDRYFQAYPALAQNQMEPLRRETKILPGQTVQGMVIVGFPVNQQTFDQRKSLRVMIALYDHATPVKIQQ
jgi:hypothetical protein